MKTVLQRLVSLVLALVFLAAASCASAAAVGSAPADSSSAMWESVFLAVLAACEITADPAFIVTEYPEREPAFRFEHALGIGDCMQMSYYDDGNGTYHSSILTIDLSQAPIPEEQAYAAIFGILIACDLESTQEQWFDLMEALCPMFDDVLSGAERLNGAQAATLNGITYMMELSDDAKNARFFTNVWLKNND